MKNMNCWTLLSHACWTVSCFEEACHLCSFLSNDTSKHSSSLALKWIQTHLYLKKQGRTSFSSLFSLSFPFGPLCTAMQATWLISRTSFPLSSYTFIHWAETFQAGAGSEEHHGRWNGRGDSSTKQLFWLRSPQVWYWACCQQNPRGCRFKMETPHR